MEKSMVFDHVIVLAAAVFASQQTDEQAIAVASRVAERFACGVSDRPIGKVYSKASIIARDQDAVRLEYGRRLFVLGATSGEVWSFGDMIELPDLSKAEVPRLTDAQILFLAQDYWRFLGHREPLGFYAIRQVSLEAGGIVQIDLLPTLFGIPMHYDHGVTMHLTRYGGRCRWFAR